MRSFAALTLLVTIASALGSYQLLDKRLDVEWNSFKDAYGKKYSLPSEELRRRLIWQRHRRIIREHNARAELGLQSYRLAINEFADMMIHEALSKLVQGIPEASNSLGKLDTTNLADLPDTVDWAKAGYVTPVRDQGMSGSAVGIAVTGSIEGVLGMKKRKLIPLAYQQIEDCYKDQFIPGAFESVIKIGGIMSDAAYSNSTEIGTCHFDPKQSECSLKACRKVDETEQALQASVANIGPIVIAINADKFIFYDSGIFDDDSCGVNGPDHALLVTGYGSENGTDFWSLKNSWGSSWGEKGYIRIKRNSNICNVANFAYYPVLA